MTANLLYGLLPDHLVLALMLVLMSLEMARLDARWARGVFAAGVLAALAVVAQQLATGYAADIVAGEVRVDHYALVGKAVLLGCGLLAGLAFAGREAWKFWLLLASSLYGGLVILDSVGFAALFLGIEMVSLPGFALMVLGGGRTPAVEGAFKYLLLSSVASALLLFGASLSYGATGQLSLGSLTQGLSGSGGQLLAAGLLVLSGLFLKIAVFPFHAWAPDAYAGARLRVTAQLASVAKVAVVFALVRAMGGTILTPSIAALVCSLAILSIVYGNLVALGQLTFRRLLAYSSIAHAGYMAIALVDTTGARADDLLVYVAVYAVATLAACASFAVLAEGDDDRLQRLDGAYARHPVAAVVLAAAMLSLAGLPPLPGFFAKLLVFRSVVASGHLTAAVVAFVGSFLGLAVYVAIVLRLFRTDAASDRTTPEGGAQAAAAQGMLHAPVAVMRDGP